MKIWQLPRRNGQWLEWPLALAVLAGLIYVGYLTVAYGYFPQPFFWDADDTFRDWFSTAVYAHAGGAYRTWFSVYPPLSFVVLKFLGVPSCYYSTESKLARSCDWIGIGAIHAIFVINAILIAMTFMKIDRKTALQRSFVLAAGMPMLFGLERGNLVLLCFTFVLLGFGPLLKSTRWKWFFAGLAVNLKVYIIAGVLSHLLKRRWLWVEGVFISIAGIWAASFAIYGSGTPIEIYHNIINFTNGFQMGSVLDVWYTNTFNSLKFVLEYQSMINIFIGSEAVSRGILAINVTVHLAQLIIILAALATWLRPEVVPAFRVTFFGIALVMITSETGPYTQPIMFLFVFMERWEGWWRPLAIAVCYILCIPGDIHLGSVVPVYQFSYISGHYLFFNQGIALGMFLRPFLFLLPAYFLGIHTLYVVWVDIRQQGWKQRWRFRHDSPLLPGVQRPAAPSESTSLSATPDERSDP